MEIIRTVNGTHAQLTQDLCTCSKKKIQQRIPLGEKIYEVATTFMILLLFP